MKKTKIFFLILAIALLLISISRKNPKSNTDYLSELDKINIEKPVVMGVNKHVVDFSACQKKDSFKIVDSSNTVKFDITGKEEAYCVVSTAFETPIGSYTNTCKVPQQSGVVEFEGTNFDKIASFCVISSEDSNLLDLK